MDPVKSQSPAETKLHFLDYWRIIRIRKTVILAVFLLVVLTTTAVTLSLTKSYSSTVRLEVQKDSTDITPLLGMPTVSQYDPYFIHTEYEKIQSKGVLYPVITNLGLDKVWAKRADIPSLSVSEAFLLLKRAVDVRESRNTTLLEVSVVDEDRELAAKIANEIAAVYKTNRLKLRHERSNAGIEVLKVQLEDQELKVRENQTNVDNLRIKLNISDSLAEGGNASTMEPETTRRIEMERIAAESQWVELKTMFDSLKVKTRKDLKKSVTVAFPYDPVLPDLMKEADNTEQQLAALQPDLGEENPKLKRFVEVSATINRQIDDRLDGLLQGLEARVNAAKMRVDHLREIVENAKTNDVKKAAEYQPYFKQKRDLDLEIRYRDVLRGKILQETADFALPKSSIVEITDVAEPSIRPASPRVALNITLGVIVGLVIGIGLAFFIEYLDTSVKTIDDVERALQAPVLGVIPQNVGSLLAEGPDSPHAEAYRVLRTNVLFTRKDKTDNALTVVSGGAGEGKSTTIFNLAVVFAQNGQRILLVDSDLRRPSLHKILNISNSIGLTNYLLKQNTFEEVIQTTKVPTLDFLPSGKLPSSSLGILNSSQMKEFVQEAKRRYDFVFFDSPPIMGVSDASVLASEVDLALLVVQYRKYPQAMTIRAKQMVEKVGGGLLGVVLNNINISQDSYYYYYSGYYYDYYSKTDDGEGSTKKNGEKKKSSGGRTDLDIKKKF